MSVRQYIGARYIPLFMGNWDTTMTYEPLSVVSYQGNSYISRQYVPANIQITNEDYWFLWSNYNAQIESYRSEVAQVRSDVNDLQDEMDTKVGTEAIEGLETEIAAKASTADLGTAAFKDASDTVSYGSSNLPTSNAVYNAIQSATHSSGQTPLMIIFGDSWTDFDNYQNWAEEVAAFMHCDYRSFGVGGASFVHTQDNLISTQLTTALATLTSDDIERCKYVVIVGGVNDFHPEAPTGFNEALSNFIISCIGAFPNAVVQYAPNNCRPGYHSTTETTNKKSFNIFKKAWEYLHNNNVYGLGGGNNRNFCMSELSTVFWLFCDYPSSTFFDNSNLHLSQYGRRAFANVILNGFGFKDLPKEHYVQIATESGRYISVAFRLGLTPIIKGSIRTDTTGGKTYTTNVKIAELCYYLFYFVQSDRTTDQNRTLYNLIFTGSSTIYGFLNLAAEASGTIIGSDAYKDPTAHVEINNASATASAVGYLA